MNIRKGTSSMRFYHISEEIIEPNTIFTPRIPRNTLTETGNEENQTARVCFAPSVDQCLMAMCNTFGEYHIYEPVDYTKLDIVHNTKAFVPDSIHTEEIWSLTSTALKRVGSIYVYDYPEWEGVYPLAHKVNNRYRGEVTSWDWNTL